MLLLTVMASAKVVVFESGVTKGTATTASQTDIMYNPDGVEVTATKPEGSQNGGCFGVDANYRIGKGGLITITSEIGNITKVVFTCTVAGTSQYGPGNFVVADDGTGEYTYEGKIGTWEGDNEVVKLVAAGAQVRFTKMEVTIADGDNGDDIPTYENLADLKFNLTTLSLPATIKVKLNNTQVTFANSNTDDVVLEDASAGILIQESGLGAFVEAGQIFNGELVVTIDEDEYGYGLPVYAVADDVMDNITVTNGTLNPLVLNDDNLFDFINDFEYRLTKFTDCVVSYDGYEVHAHVPVLDATIGLMDSFEAIPEDQWPEEGAVVDITGYYTDYFGLITYIQPISFEVKGQAQMVEVNTIAEFKSTYTPAKLNLTDAQVNVISEDYEGIFIQDATGGLFLSGVELDVEAGQKLSGSVIGTFGSYDGFEAFVPAEDEDGSNLTVADGTLEVKTVTISEAAKAVNDLRLVKVSGTYFAEEFAMYDLIENPAIVDESEEPLFISNLFFVLDENQEIEDDTDVTVTGLIRLDRSFESYFGTTALTIIPVSIDGQNALSTGLKDVKKVMENGQLYNLNGVRVAAPQKGIYIQNGKKVIVK